MSDDHGSLRPSGQRRVQDRERLKAAAEQLLSSDGWQRWVRVRARGGLARLSLNSQVWRAGHRPPRAAEPAGAGRALRDPRLHPERPDRARRGRAAREEAGDRPPGRQGRRSQAGAHPPRWLGRRRGRRCARAASAARAQDPARRRRRRSRHVPGVLAARPARSWRISSRCGELRPRRGRDRETGEPICERCYRRARPGRECDLCGRAAQLAGTGARGGPRLCGACAERERRPRRVCGRCGRFGAIALLQAADGTRDLCFACYGREPRRVCGGCGQLAAIHVRGRDGNPDLWRRCYRPPIARCSVCGRERPCCHTDTDTPVCWSCTPRRVAECAACGPSGRSRLAVRSDRCALAPRRPHRHRPAQRRRTRNRCRAPSRWTLHLPLDVNDDREFWEIWESGPQFGTPLYYRPHLERFPERTAAVVAAIANAAPGGVAFDCGGGRDGQIAMVLLALLGVAPSDIAADYMLSYERLPARYAARGEDDQGPLLQAFLENKGTTASHVIIATLQSLDVEAQVRVGGLTDCDLTRLRDRLHSEK